jgi:hypothetical protein
MIDEELIEQKPPFDVMLRLWWGLTWRVWAWLLLSMAAVMVVGALVGVFVAVTGGGKAEALHIIKPLGLILGIGTGIGATMQAIRGILGRTFGGRRLVLLKPEQ